MWIKRVIEALFDLLARLPSTNSRIALTLFLSLGTGLRYWASKGPDPWEPTWEWLAFLATMAGLDVAQFANKRRTNTEYVKAQNKVAV